MNKLRLDDLLVQRGVFSEHKQAVRAILAGRISSADAILSQPGIRIDPKTPLSLRPVRRYVSRGGEKLEKALAVFSLSPKGLRCIDIGASTGGFTDCLLQNGAVEVCAVDVGYGQFAWELRNDSRVRLFERTNINAVHPVELGAPFDIAVIDVSFNRVGRLVKNLETLLAEQGHCLALIKPQFELPRSLVKNGVIVEQDLHTRALESVLEKLAQSLLAPRSLTYSPIKGPKGNIEFLLWAQKGGVPDTILVHEIVEAAHAYFDETQKRNTEAARSS